MDPWARMEVGRVRGIVDVSLGLGFQNWMVGTELESDRVLSQDLS
jgi:hypothetical protein